MSTLTLPELIDRIRPVDRREQPGSSLDAHSQQASTKARNELVERGIDINDPETARVIAAFCDAIGTNVTSAFNGDFTMRGNSNVMRFYGAFTEITGGTCAAIVERHGGGTVT